MDFVGTRQSFLMCVNFRQPVNSDSTDLYMYVLNENFKFYNLQDAK